MTLEDKVERLERIVLELALIALQGTGSLHKDLREVLKQIERELEQTP